MNKDKVTNICAIVMVVSGALLAGDKAGTIEVSTGIESLLGILATGSGALVAYFTGKPSNPPK